MRKKDLNILKHHDWIFIKYDGDIIEKDIQNIRALTCVNFVKKSCRIKSLWIQTPGALLKYLTK